LTPTFEQLKKGYFKIALLKALATGITATLFTTGGILLGTKLAEVVFPILYAILIGVAAGGLVGGLAFLLLKKTAKALAKRLDEGYELHEKVQTMLEYKDENREMVLLQRSNAEAQLQAKTGGKAKAGKLWINAVAVALALGVFVSGIAIPATALGGGGGGGEDPYEFSNWQYNSMLELIAYVDDSPMHADLKPSSKATLEQLLDDVCDYDEQTNTVTTTLTRTEMVLKVKESITVLDASVEEYNTYKKLYNTLTLTQSEMVVDYANALRLLDGGEPISDLRDKMVDEEEDAAQLSVKVESFASEITASFSVAEVPASDPLLTASKDFMQAIIGAAQKVSIGYKAYQVALDSAFDLKKDAVDVALEQQSENRGAFDYMIAELVKIFEINNPPYTGGESLPVINLSGDGSDSEEGGGAAGEGGIQFGSKEEVYYPDEQKKVEYGEIFIDYDAKKDEILKELGITDEKLKEIIEAYFEKLYGSSGLNKQP
jgi:hypothetical protein